MNPSKNFINFDRSVAVYLWNYGSAVELSATECDGTHVSLGEAGQQSVAIGGVSLTGRERQQRRERFGGEEATRQTRAVWKTQPKSGQCLATVGGRLFGKRRQLQRHLQLEEQIRDEMRQSLQGNWQERTKMGQLCTEKRGQ